MRFIGWVNIVVGFINISMYLAIDQTSNWSLFIGVLALLFGMSAIFIAEETGL